MVSMSKTFLIRPGIVLLGILLLGWTLKSFFSPRKQSQVPPSPQSLRPAAGIDPSSLANLYAAAAIAGDPKVIELMSRYRLGPRAAKYVSQAKMQVLDQTDTSVHVAITFPDKVSIDEVATVAADRGYSPTPAEIASAMRRSLKVHGPKLTFTKKSDGSWAYALQYHVPYSAVPGDLLQKIQPGTTNKANASHFLDLVPEARAQGDGKEVTGEAVISVIANYTAEAYKGLDPRSVKNFKELEEGLEAENLKSLGADGPLALIDFLEDMGQLRSWNQELSEMEDCAKNPTNPLSQKASHDGNYQHDVLDQLEAADGDVNSTIVPTLASDTAGYLSHFLPFGGGAVTTLVFSTQDEAVSEYANGRIEEARKYIVPCDKEPEMTAFGYKAMAGKFEYKYNASRRECTHQGSEQGCNTRTETRQSSGTFNIDPNATDANAEASNVGAGSFDAQGGFETLLCHGQTHEHGGGPLKIHVEVGGIPESAIVSVNASGDWDAQMDHINTCGVGSSAHSAYKAIGGAACEFKNVNMVTGGHYSAFVAADQGHGTCTMELERK
jgi:hypothetical protein